MNRKVPAVTEIKQKGRGQHIDDFSHILAWPGIALLWEIHKCTVLNRYHFTIELISFACIFQYYGTCNVERSTRFFHRVFIDQPGCYRHINLTRILVDTDFAYHWQQLHCQHRSVTFGHFKYVNYNKVLSTQIVQVHVFRQISQKNFGKPKLAINDR